ncbi:TPA: phage holin [Staphylococcus pseudintermedius]|uniref:Phage holin n=1 Tax=Staphylococcus pseudintermedius TaxID=283734 RepID=A0A3D8YJI4_STAPS|nr:phage holin [Staphylococcus pseudintermedius]EGQ1305880.1 phage holin [Staphylococcus pseudintermedius]EGQ1694876.1 phage holin [Staphylococcus pseudintermedius]EGQ1765698.1 phage holin [Staphylococcus pseudintermedius]EGQ1786228.1 phage holin [Staphylococcus pseudintermedius]EGQ2671199.1 phage holin [Staphylococcus pseudintermedius]
MINWKVRIKQKTFWVAMLSAIFLFAQSIAKVLGYDIQVYTEQLTDALNSILGILVLMGVIQDPTTQGVSDSHQALNYEEPRQKY